MRGVEILPLPTRDSRIATLRSYIVGGAVRDGLLGLPIQDRDHVVVGATPQDMVALGFRPVGRDFPVFLHPDSGEEYALARTERKTARGYKGFAVHAAADVTLEQDLLRRDLTINAMALAPDGSLIDPYGGRADLEGRVFRHVSAAFAEDPVRILRVARFAARFGAGDIRFELAPETLGLMQAMAAAGEVDALVPERVWQELARGLMEATPSRMFRMLRECGALARLLPELDRLFGVPQPAQHHPEIDTGEHVMRVIDAAARQGLDLPARVAALLHDLGKGATPQEFWPKHHGHEGRGVELVRGLCERLRAPLDCRDLAILVARDHGNAHRALELRPATLLELLQRTDALRRPERFEDFLAACAADAHGREGYEARPYPQSELLRRALVAARSVDAGALAQGVEPAAIAQTIAQARITAIAAALRSS